MIKRRSDFISNNETDPMASLVNMVDIMLVLAVGFLILAISATGMADTSQSQQSAQAPQQEVVDVSQGQEVPNNIEKNSSSGSGYSRVGSVYEDPETGKLVMIDN